MVLCSLFASLTAICAWISIPAPVPFTLQTFAVFFSLLRKAFIVFPLTVLLPRLWGLGVDGVFLAEPISNLIGGVACFATMIATIWPMLKREERAQEGKP